MSIPKKTLKGVQGIGGVSKTEGDFHMFHHIFQWLKGTTLILCFGILPLGCGDKTDNMSLEEYVNSINLSGSDTKEMEVPLPLADTLDEFSKKGRASKTDLLPFDFNKIEKIIMFTISGGTRKLIAHSTWLDNENSRGRDISQRIDSITFGNRVWLTDYLDNNQTLARVNFFQSSQISMDIDLFRLSNQDRNNQGTRSFAPLIQMGQTSAKFYIHFKQKK